MSNYNQQDTEREI